MNNTLIKNSNMYNQIKNDFIIEVECYWQKNKML